MSDTMTELDVPGDAAVVADPDACAAGGAQGDATVGTRSALRRRVLDQLSWTVQMLADEVHRYGPAWGVRTPSLPQVWTLNQLHVTDAMAVDEVVAMAGWHQRDSSFLHVEVEDEATARALEQPLRAEEWTVDCEVLMALGPVSSVVVSVPAADIVDLDEGEATRVMRRWLGEEYPGLRDPVLAQLEQYTQREGRLWGERVLGIRGADGEPAAMTKVRVKGNTVWVEDVFTVPEERRRGHARKLVTRAASLAATAVDTTQGAGIAFIVADDNDWPKHLYAEVGFGPVGRVWTFHREKGDSSP
jgi:predicted GNAT family acetyltransferase